MPLHDLDRPLSEGFAVPRLALEGKWLQVPLQIEWSCHCCAFRVSAVSEAALQRAMDEHAAYVNATKDHATDEHFHEVRMDSLLAR